jgi:hypothetical protein
MMYDGRLENQEDEMSVLSAIIDSANAELHAG